MGLSIQEADEIWRTEETVEYELLGKRFIGKITRVVVGDQKAVILGREQGADPPNRYLGEVSLARLNKGGKNG